MTDISKWCVGDLAYMAEGDGVYPTGSVIPVGWVAVDGSPWTAEYSGNWLSGTGRKPLRVLQPGDVVPAGATIRWISGVAIGKEWTTLNGWRLSEGDAGMSALVSLPEPEPEPDEDCCGMPNTCISSAYCAWRDEYLSAAATEPIRSEADPEPFKVGDVVRCVEEITPELENGRNYVVTERRQGQIRVSNNEGEWWALARFVLADLLDRAPEVGDRVICVDADDQGVSSELRLGQVYTVEEYSANTQLVGLVGHGMLWRKQRFRVLAPGLRGRWADESVRKVPTPTLSDLADTVDKLKRQLDQLRRDQT
jgi:hypothetical protein